MTLQLQCTIINLSFKSLSSSAKLKNSHRIVLCTTQTVKSARLDLKGVFLPALRWALGRDSSEEFQAAKMIICESVQLSQGWFFIMTYSHSNHNPIQKQRPIKATQLVV